MQPYPFLLYLSLILITPISRAECPRKKNGGDARFGETGAGHPGAKAPGVVPPETLISCTFMHNDKTEIDLHFSNDVLAVLDQITERLKRKLHLTLKVEVVSCTEGNQPKCLEYSLEEPFHWLIVDDPKYGAGVYEISQHLNSKRTNIEASVLDVLSRHSVYDLTEYCSKEAEKELGFIRQMSVEELIGKQRKLEAKPYKTAISRSPFEMDLIEPILLESRTFEKPLNWHQLRRMDANTLSTAVSEHKLTFVIFWSRESVVSQYAFYLWAEASESLVVRYPEALFGALACHELDGLCEDYVTSATEQHTVFAFKSSSIYAKTKELRDPEYYIDWVRLVMVAPAQEIHSDDELKLIKTGKLESFEDIRPAITVGIFKDRECNEATIFMQVADKLRGKYHFVYYINNSHINTVYTIRAREKKKRLDFLGTFEVQELAHFVAHSSLPSMIDISRGFTSDILMHQPLPIFLLIGGNEQERLAFSERCAKPSNVICTTIKNTKKESVSQMLDALRLHDGAAKLIIFLKEKIYEVDLKSGLLSNNLLQLIAVAIVEEPKNVLGLEDVHPLRYLQLAQVNEQFGEQSVDIPSEVTFIQRTHQGNAHEVVDYGDEYGGCPMMSRARQMLAKDEL